MKKNQNYEDIAKFIIVGDSNVGKTSIMKRYCYGDYTNTTSTSIGLQYGQKIDTLSKKKVLVQIWDTAGQQRFKSITPSFYRSAMGIVLAFSVDDKQSFNSIAIWIKQIRTFADQKIPIIITGNKCDLQKRQVTEKQCEKLSQAYNLQVIMTSAKENINIQQLIIKLYSSVQKNNKQKLKSQVSSTSIQPKVIKKNAEISGYCSC